jgi:hypothetical protein
MRSYQQKKTEASIFKTFYVTGIKRIVGKVLNDSFRIGLGLGFTEIRLQIGAHRKKSKHERSGVRLFLYPLEHHLAARLLRPTHTFFDEMARVDTFYQPVKFSPLFHIHPVYIYMCTGCVGNKSNSWLQQNLCYTGCSKKIPLTLEINFFKNRLRA